jgi:hypothetical protein
MLIILSPMFSILVLSLFYTSQPSVFLRPVSLKLNWILPILAAASYCWLVLPDALVLLVVGKRPCGGSRVFEVM